MLYTAYDTLRLSAKDAAEGSLRTDGMAGQRNQSSSTWLTLTFSCRNICAFSLNLSSLSVVK